MQMTPNTRNLMTNLPQSFRPTSRLTKEMEQRRPGWRQNISLVETRREAVVRDQLEEQIFVLLSEEAANRPMAKAWEGWLIHFIREK